MSRLENSIALFKIIETCSFVMPCDGYLIRPILHRIGYLLKYYEQIHSLSE